MTIISLGVPVIRHRIHNAYPERICGRICLPPVPQPQRQEHHSHHDDDPGPVLRDVIKCLT
jgi:hypothetical protein